MAFFGEEMRDQARRRRLRIMDIGAGFAGGNETTALLRELSALAADDD